MYRQQDLPRRSRIHVSANTLHFCMFIVVINTEVGLHETFEPPLDKTNNVVVRPVKTQISLGIRPAWKESSLSAWRTLRSFATHWVHSEDCDQTGRMPRLIWVFAGHTFTVLVLSQGGSFPDLKFKIRLNEIEVGINHRHSF